MQGRPNRSSGSLAAQAEWQTRMLPAAADQMTYEGNNCAHFPITEDPSRFDDQSQQDEAQRPRRQGLSNKLTISY
jgi:hypothetical protein